MGLTLVVRAYNACWPHAFRVRGEVGARRDAGRPSPNGLARLAACIGGGDRSRTRRGHEPS